MATSRNIKKDLMKEILSYYDNTEYAFKEIKDFKEDFPPDANDVMCDMYLSELNLKTPHVVFAETISRPEGSKIRTSAMSLDVLKYYLKDPNAIFTNWVINDDSSSFSQLYYTKLTGEAIRLEKNDNWSDDAPQDILGDRQLFMDSLDTGMGGIHGERRFFQLSLSTGNYLIDSASALKLYDVDKSMIFILRERKISLYHGNKEDSELKETIDTARSAGIGSNVSTVSGTHGQAPSKIIYELIEYLEGDSGRSGRIFDRPGDSCHGRCEADLKNLNHNFKNFKWGHEEDANVNISYNDDIAKIKEDIANNYNESVYDILDTGTTQSFYNMKNKLINEVQLMEINLKELYQGRYIDIPETKNPDRMNRHNDFSFIFSEKLNTTKMIVLNRWIGKDEPINKYPEVEQVIIYTDHIPKNKNLYDISNFKNFVQIIIEDEDGKQQSICGRIVRIFSNLTSYAKQEKTFPHTKGQWIYQINLMGDKSIIVAEARVELVTDENGKEIEKTIKQIVTDEPTPLKKGKGNSDFTIQLLSRLDAINKCSNDVLNISEIVSNNANYLYIHEISESTFDYLLPHGNALEVPIGTDALRIENELPNELDNSFSDDGDYTSQHLRENYLPHPIIPDSRTVLIDGEPMTIREAINRSAENSPARQVLARNESFTQARSPFPMFPGPLSSPVMSDSARTLREFSREDDRTVSSASSTSRSLFDDDDDDDEPRSNETIGDEPRPNETIRREAAAATRRLNELENAGNVINSLNSDNNRRRGIFNDNNNNRNMRARLGESPDYVLNTPPNTPPRSPDYVPNTPPRSPDYVPNTPPDVVPETPGSQMGNFEYYRRRQNERDDERDDESKDDIN
jgi:hypothetical protein